MKVIDLLNKIANGEEVPLIKYGGKILHWNKEKDRFEDKDGMNTLFEMDFSELNDEVEVIEDIPKEDKKIQRLTFGDVDGTPRANEDDIIDKINEIIDRLNGDSDE